MSSTVKSWFAGWLDRRIPSAGEITLTQRRIFILPSKAGVWFLVLVTGLVLAAINYQNNMLFVIAFILLGLFLVSILHTYSNLSGLTIRCGGADPVFCGKQAEFKFTLLREGRRQYHNIHLGWPQSNPAVANLVSGEQSGVSLFVPAKRRGRLRLGRLLVQTWYPLGLFRAWTWLDFNAECLVYPKAEPTLLAANATAQVAENGQYAQQHGADEFMGYVDYQPGHAIKQISWSNVARGLPLMSRQYESIADHQYWIDWANFEGESVEVRLSRMCFLILSADQEQVEYGVRLPATEFAPALGETHKLAVLRALALYDDPAGRQ